LRVEHIARSKKKPFGHPQKGRAHVRHRGDKRTEGKKWTPLKIGYLQEREEEKNCVEGGELMTVGKKKRASTRNA